MNSTEASPTLQGALFLVALAYLVWEAWGGWRRGILRSGLHFAAFVFSGFLGVLAGQATAFVAGKAVPGSSLVAGLLAGSVVTLTSLGLGLLLAAVLFKRTAQQPPGPVRLFYGVGGAFFGILTGLVVLWGGITLIRASGTIAQTAFAGHSKASVPAALKTLIALKNSLELGPAGRAVESVDAVPPSAYTTIALMGKLTSDPDAMMRFLDSPGVREVMQVPSVAALLDDPSVTRAAQDRNFLALLGNPSLIKAASDPSLQKKLAAINLKKALDSAFPTPQSSPSPPRKKP